jgi:hypothetical protein
MTDLTQAEQLVLWWLETAGPATAGELGYCMWGSFPREQRRHGNAGATMYCRPAGKILSRLSSKAMVYQRPYGRRLLWCRSAEGT